MLCRTGQEESAGGVKGAVVNRSGRVPVQGAELQIFRDQELVGTVYASADGSFKFGGLEDGLYLMKVSALAGKCGGGRLHEGPDVRLPGPFERGQ